MLFALVVLDRYKLPVVGFVLERIGRYPLSIYVAHSFVLPAIDLLRHTVPAVPNVVSTLGCLLLFIAFCGYKVWASRASDRAKRAGPETGGLLGISSAS